MFAGMRAPPAAAPPAPLDSRKSLFLTSTTPTYMPKLSLYPVPAAEVWAAFVELRTCLTLGQIHPAPATRHLVTESAIRSLPQGRLSVLVPTKTPSQWFGQRGGGQCRAKKMSKSASDIRSRLTTSKSQEFCRLSILPCLQRSSSSRKSLAAQARLPWPISIQAR
jgi:hypothetical protein